MKTKIQTQKKVLAVALFAAVITTEGNLFAQSNSPNILNNGNALWQADGSDTVKTNRFVKVNNSMRVLGPLHIGLNSLTLGATFGPTATDNITSDNGVINFGGSPTFSNIAVGIGTTTTITGVGLNVLNDINTGSSYRIGGTVVLRKPGTQNIFVGLNNYS